MNSDTEPVTLPVTPRRHGPHHPPTARRNSSPHQGVTPDVTPRDTMAGVSVTVGVPRRHTHVTHLTDEPAAP